MGKLFGLILMLAALYVGMTIYTEGLEQAFGGIFAPLESVNDSTAPMATQFTPAAQSATPPAEPTRRIPILQGVHDRVTADLETGARRNRR